MALLLERKRLSSFRTERSNGRVRRAALIVLVVLRFIARYKCAAWSDLAIIPSYNSYQLPKLFHRKHSLKHR